MIERGFEMKRRRRNGSEKFERKQNFHINAEARQAANSKKKQDQRATKFGSCFEMSPFFRV